MSSPDKPEKPGKPSPKATRSHPAARKRRRGLASARRALRDPRTLDAILRTDFLAFIEKVFNTVSGGDTFQYNWHIQAMAYALEQCRTGECKRLGIFLPPRHLKSIITSIAFPAWILAHDPRCRIVCVSHSLDLSLALARQFRNVVTSDWYRALFPEAALAAKKDTESEFVTAAGGGRLAVSVGGSITGRGGDIIIIDDPMKAELANSEAVEEWVRTWFDQTLATRLNDKRKGVIVLVMQRLSVGDLAAHVVNEDWEVLRLAAIAEEHQRIRLSPTKVGIRRPGQLLHRAREGKAEYDALRRQLGTAGFAAQYQQAPIPLGGGMLRLEWFARYDVLPLRAHWDKLIHSWDTAVSEEDGASFSVWQKWVVADGKLYLADQIRRRLLYPELRQLAFALIARDQPDHVLIEHASSGQALMQEVFDSYSVRERRLRVPFIRPDRDKVVRAARVSPMIEEGRVVLPRKAAFLEVLEGELRAFPGGRHDDQVDAMVQALRFYQEIWRYRPPRVYLIGR